VFYCSLRLSAGARRICLLPYQSFFTVIQQGGVYTPAQSFDNAHLGLDDEDAAAAGGAQPGTPNSATVHRDLVRKCHVGILRVREHMSPDWEQNNTSIGSRHRGHLQLRHCAPRPGTYASSSTAQIVHCSDWHFTCCDGTAWIIRRCSPAHPTPPPSTTTWCKDEGKGKKGVTPQRLNFPGHMPGACSESPAMLAVSPRQSLQWPLQSKEEAASATVAADITSNFAIGRTD